MVLTNLQVPGKELSEIITEFSSDSVLDFSEDWVQIDKSNLLKILNFMHTNSNIDAAQLCNLTAVDMLDYFEVHYHLQSLDLKKLYSLKVIIDRDTSSLPSICDIYLGANLQEREIFDLFGITFTNHPDLRRIFLWEGFVGHPLRKDFLQMENVTPGLPSFPFEEEGKQNR
jgi:NADH-quinone oxidoreductase subunit C